MEGPTPWYGEDIVLLKDLVSKETTVILDRNGLNWPTTVTLVLIHLGALAAFFFFTWKALAVTVFLYWMATGLGISMGYHRLHTHRSYKVPPWMEYFFALCGTLTLEGGPIFWTAIHRIHHQRSDQPGDPHSPREGAWWAHVGWILVGETKHNNTKLLAKYSPDLAKDRFYVWLNDYHWLPNVVLAGLVFARRRAADAALGRLFPRCLRTARHLAGEFGHAHVGRTPLRHARRLAQQLVGGSHFLRRGLAQ